MQVGLAVLQEQHVRGIAANVDDKEPGGVQHHAALGHYCRESLWEYHYMVYLDSVGLVTVGEPHALNAAANFSFSPP